MAAAFLLALIPISYFLGSIPFGLIVGKANGIDVRKAGSGNIGATNVGRLLGRRFFWLVFSLDLLKGMLPSLAAALALNLKATQHADYLLWLAVAFAAILGHMFSVFLSFKGGKGVATSAGVLLGLWPYFTLPAIAGLGVFCVTFALTRYISVASMVGAISFPIIYAAIGLTIGWPVLGEQLPLLIASSLLAGMIVYRHRGNIRRLMNGTENRAGR